jgi:hypothetical protein
VYEPHFWVKRPTDENVSIWRYLKFDRFLDLLERRQLHFARFDQYPDPWEGVLPPETVALARDGFRNEPLRAGESLTDFQMLVRDVNRTNKLCSFANCWFMNEHESDGMWRLYAPEGVAIRSTFNRLCASFVQAPEMVHVGEVRYIDFRTEQPPTYGNTLAVAYYKRRQFEHERELRAVVVNVPAQWTSGTPPLEELGAIHPNFMKIDVDVETLIEDVYVAPGRPESFREQVHQALGEYVLDRTIESSALDERPTLI